MWTLILSLCICVCSVMTLMFCLCWRKKTPKNDLLGLHGMVTQKNPDENVNHLPSTAPCVVDSRNVVINSVETEPNKRTTTTTNTRRSLPDIPSEQVGEAINWEPTGDNSSEHYATLGQYQNAKRHTLPNGIEARSSISQHSSISQPDDAFSPYEKVKYDKIKQKEHPYAQLQPTTSRQPVVEETNLSGDERTNLLRTETPGGSGEPSVVSRSRRSSQNGLTVDIPAASAVAGGIAASPELPYMTPPVNQSNFSGDSQDSSKGYTSISVREPLANIRAQTKELINKKRELDPHYSTVSDDSDDVYTTIPDPNNQIYTSESETYARIPALPITVEAEVNPVYRSNRSLDQSDDIGDGLYEPAPQPPLPSVDSLKQVTGSTHSRQASSSSSIANVGSPKPEKRQANSPLPPPPTAAAAFDFHIDKAQCSRNLDDLYAKVHKNKRKEESDGDNSPDKNRKSYDITSSRRSVSSTNSNDDKKYLESELVEMNQPTDHNYETLRKMDKSCNDPGYEKIKNEEPGYASINGPDSITQSDPGYEMLKHRPPSEIDPNYEELRHRTSNASDCAGYSKINYNNTRIIDGYSVVNKKNKSEDKSKTSSSYGSNSQDASLDEPNYESMPSETASEHNYAALKSTGSESDPNYESVNQIEHSFDTTSHELEEPPYEKVKDDDIGYEKVRGRGYENVDTSESSNGDGDKIVRKLKPPYETLVDDSGDSEVPGYEKINNTNSSIESNSSESNKEPNYATINDKNSLQNSNNVLEEDAIVQV